MLLERLANTRNATVAKDAQATGEERLALPIAFYVLTKKKSNDRLRGGEPGCFHVSAN
jgi:hypothetical protein